MQIQTGSVQGLPNTSSVTPPSSSVSLRPGDTLRAQVVSLSDGQVTLRLASGEEMRAQMAAGVTLAVGQEVQLTVSTQDQSRMVMRLMGEGVGREVTVELSSPELIRGGDQRTQALYNAMRQVGLAPTKENLHRVEQLITRFPQLDTHSAAFLAANVKTLPPAGQDGLLHQLAQAFSQPQQTPQLDLLTTLFATAFESGQLPTTAQLLAQLPPEAAQVLASALAEAQAPPLATTPAVTTAAAGTVPSPPAAPAPLPEGIPVAQGIQQPPAPQESIAALGRYLQQASPEGFRALAAAGGLQDAAAMLMVAAKLPPDTAAQAVRTMVAQVLPPEMRGTIAQQSLSTALGQALSALRAMPTEGGGMPPQAPLPMGANAAQAVPNPAQPPVATLPQGDAGATIAPALPVTVTELLTLARSIFAKLPAGTPEQSGAELQRATVTLAENLQAVRMTTTVMAGHEAYAALAYQAEARAAAMPQIMQFTFLQVPVQVSDHEQVADLYVMRRSGKKPGEQEEYTVLIALETEYMGRVEVVLTERERAVSLTFRMNEGPAMEEVRDEMPVLRDSIESLGYRMREAILQRLDEPVSPQTFVSLLDDLQSQRTALDLTV